MQGIEKEISTGKQDQASSSSFKTICRRILFQMNNNYLLDGLAVVLGLDLQFSEGAGSQNQTVRSEKYLLLMFLRVN